MIRQRMTVRLTILFLLLGTTMAWSHRIHRPKSAHAAEDTVAESKITSRYSHEPKSSYYGEHEHYPKGGGDSEEYVDSEEVKSHKESEEAVGKEESDDTVKNDEYLDHSEKSGKKGFEAGGASFDKHLKDHKADNKEVENVKEHDVGEKFGGEATKEHKLGKHKEKSKGHKLHGFKNVYHKEEYGDHKTFHDEFLDTDHQHNYDDHHEHQEVKGGKFSKGFKHEGKNKKFDKGDEKHEWGKEDHDANYEGKHESGKQSSKHRHGSKKHQGHYDGNVQRNKNAVHKIKKGVPPPPPLPPYVPHGGHHGPHQAQIQSVVPHFNPHHDPVVHVQPHQYKPHTHQQSHQVNYDEDGDKHSSHGDHGNQYHNHDGHHGSHHHHNGGHHNGGHHNGGHHNDEREHSSEENDDHESDYHDRTARNHKHRSSKKDELEDKSDEKFSPIAKHEPVVHRNEPLISKHEPIAHKQSVSPNYGVHHYRQPVFQESSSFKPSEPVKQEKYSNPLSDRSHNHRIRYGYQPRNLNHHNHQHHNHPSHHSFNSHHRQQLQPFPRFPGYNHHHRGHGHHHHGGDHKTRDHFRHAPSSYQQQPKVDILVPKAEQASNIKPIRSEDHHRFSQKLYK